MRNLLVRIAVNLRLLGLGLNWLGCLSVLKLDRLLMTNAFRQTQDFQSYLAINVGHTNILVLANIDPNVYFSFVYVHMSLESEHVLMLTVEFIQRKRTNHIAYSHILDPVVLLRQYKDVDIWINNTRVFLIFILNEVFTNNWG